MAFVERSDGWTVHCRDGHEFAAQGSSSGHPAVEFHHLETPSPYTVGGFKGVGEAGVAGAPAAITNAVNDALAPFGVSVREHPITPDRIRALLVSRARDS